MSDDRNSNREVARNKFERGVPSFKGKVVWVTGASSGIGREIAYLLAALRAYVIVTARNHEALMEVVAACGGDERCRPLPYDLQDTKGLPGLVTQAEQMFGQIDAVFHAAGVSQRSLAADTSPDVMRQIMAVNYDAPTIITSLVLPEMIDRGSGLICAVSSLAAYIPTPLRSSYTGAKMGLHGYFDSLRLELRRSGVRIMMAIPGFVKTEISLRALTGGGTAHGKMDQAQAHGMDPGKCARKIVQGALAGKEELEIGFGFKGRLAIFLKSMAPGLLTRRLAKEAKRAEG